MSRLDTAEIVIDAVDWVPLRDGIDQTEVVLYVSSTTRPTLHLPRDEILAEEHAIMLQTGAGIFSSKPIVMDIQSFVPVDIFVGSRKQQDLESEEDVITFVTGSQGIAAEIPIPPPSSGSQSNFWWG